MISLFLSATDFPIKSVKAFSCGEAEVTRIFTLDFTRCRNESLVVEISKLPIMLGTLRPPAVTIGSEDLLITHYYSSRPNSFSTGPPDVSSDVLRDLNVRCKRLEYERHLRQKILSTFMDFLAASAIETAEPAELVPFFDDVVESGKNLFKRITVLDRQISDIQKEVRKEIVRLHHEYSTLATTVTVVLAPVPGHTIGNAELELVYRVKATWKPIYGLHLTTIDGIPSSSAILTYQCHISQSTGEDWDDVELVITTAKPDVPSVGLPEPKKIQLVQRFSYRDSYHRPEVRTSTSSWNSLGQGSAFNSFMSLPQHTAFTDSALSGSTQSATSSEDSSEAQGLPLVDSPGCEVLEGMGPEYGDVFPAPRNYLQSSGPPSHGLFGSAPAQSSFGFVPVPSFFGPAQVPSLFGPPQVGFFQVPSLFGYPRVPSLFGSSQVPSLFGCAPAQSYAGGLFGAPLPLPQSQMSSTAIADPYIHYTPSLNSASSQFGGSTAPDNASTFSSNQSASNVQQSGFSSLSDPAPYPTHHNGKGVGFAEREKDVTHITLAATAKAFISSRKEAHHILVATIPLNASFTRVAVPAVDPRVFYTCEVTNSSNYALPPGPVHTYLDGRHVSNSKVASVAQPQNIQCSLGVDPAITTEIERRIAGSERAPIFPTDERKTHTITIIVKNTHEGSIDDLLVRASLPVAQNSRIRVSLREPVCLTNISSGTPLVRDKCPARWSTTGECAGKKGGVFEWVCSDVQPGSLVLKAAWDVSAPREFNVVEQ